MIRVGADGEQPFLAVVLVLDVADRVLPRVDDVGVVDVMPVGAADDLHSVKVILTTPEM